MEELWLFCVVMEMSIMNMSSSKILNWQKICLLTVQWLYDFFSFSAGRHYIVPPQLLSAVISINSNETMSKMRIFIQARLQFTELNQRYPNECISFN